MERDDDLRRLHELCAESRRGTGRVAVVSGAVGSGKTALLDAFLRFAGEQGATVAHATASHAEQSLPLGVVHQLLSQSGVPERDLVQIHRALSGDAVAALMCEPGPEAATPAATIALQELGKALLALARRAPLVLAVDDAQYTDIASMRALSHLVRHMRTARVLVVLTTCVGLRPLHPLLHAEVLRQPHSYRIRLDPLTQAGVAQLLDQHLDRAPGPHLAPTLHAASGGNPLLVGAMVEDCVAAARHQQAELVSGEALDQAVLGCLCRLEPTTRRVAEALAVLSGPESRTTIARLLELEAETVGQHVTVLEQAGLLLGGRYRHPRVPVAVLNRITAGTRAEMHRRSALLLHQDDAPAVVVARHLIAADHVDAPWMIALLQEAAEQALDEEDIDLALDCLRLAHRHCADGPQRTAIRSLLMRVEWWTNPSVASRHLDDLVTAVRNGTFRGSRAVMLLDHLLWQGRYADVADVVRLLTADGPLDAETARYLLPVRLSLFYGFPALCSALPDEDSADAFGARVPASDVLCGLDYLLDGTRLDDHQLSLSLTMLGALVRADRFDEVDVTTDEESDGEPDGRAPTWRALVAAVRAEAAHYRGDFDTALHLARTALTVITPRSWGVFVGAPLATLINAATGAGRADLAAQYAALSVPAEMLQTVMGVRYLHARGRFYLTEGRPQEALNDFLACRDLTSTWRLDLAATVPWWIDAARALLRLDRRAQARELLLSELRRLGPDHTRFRGTTIRLLAATADAGRRPALLREAVRVLRDSGDREELARTFADLGHALHELGEVDRARMMLRTAQQMRTRTPAGLSTLVHQRDVTRLEVGDPGGDGEGVADLSEAERRVAALAAVGHTNREIASKLFVTVSTVEQHLTRVYRKLGVAGRNDLPAHLDLDTADRRQPGAGIPAA